MFSASRLRIGLVLLGAALLLVLHSLRFDFVTDDAFISFVYAKNLARHGELVFNLGERVEGYTNFLWTLILALGMRLGVMPELSSRVLGTLCGAATLVVTARLMRLLRAGARAEEQAPPWSLWDGLPALILAGVPGYACWSSGGLETQLFTLLVTWGGAEYLRGHLAAAGTRDERGLLLSGLLLGLAALTRPEGYLFFGLLGLHGLVTKWRRRDGARPWVLPTRSELGWALGFLGLAVPHLLWRHHYYGYWVPNTFYIKASGGRAAWGQGLYYLMAFGRDLKLYVFPILWGLGLLRAQAGEADRRYRAAGAVMLLWTGVFLLYVASVGGDFMGLYRFVLPVVPLVVVCGVLGLRRQLAGPMATPAPSLDATQRGRLRAVGAVALLLILHAWNTARVDRHALTFIGADRGIDTPGYLRHYTRDRAAIGQWLGHYVQPDDYQVVGGAGAQVYYAGIRALDSFGLSDAYVAHEVPPVSTRPGHQKFAPLSYVLSRRPTILTYNVYRIDDAPYTPSAAEAAMWRSYGFHYVSVQIPGLSRPWYSFLKRLDRSLGPLPAVPAEGQSP